MEIFMDKIYWKYWVSNKSMNVESHMSIRQKNQVLSFFVVFCNAGITRAIKFLRKMGLPRMFTKQVGRVQ